MLGVVAGQHIRPERSSTEDTESLCVGLIGGAYLKKYRSVGESYLRVASRSTLG